MKLRDEEALTPEDRSLIETVEAGLRPASMDPARAIRFRRAVEDRVSRRRVSWRSGGFVVAATAAAAAVLWFAAPEAPSLSPGKSSVATSSTASGPEPLLYAYVDPDAYGDTSDPEEYLPEDYLALSVLLDVDA